MNKSTKSIKVLYFAILKDERGLDSEVIETEVSNAQELYCEIKDKHQLTIAPERLTVAINDEMSSWQEKLSSNDVVAFLPPVAGG